MIDAFLNSIVIAAYIGAMDKDRRYDTVKKLIGSGHVNTLQDIIDIIPKTILTRDLGMHHITFNKLLTDPYLFTFGDTKKMAAIIEVDTEVIFRIVLNTCLATEAKTKKTRKKK